jgi:ABC-type sugar transport system ATPase subunit
MASITLAGVQKRFGATKVIPNIDLAIPDGAFCVFVGPSGCGKSTLLRLIAGLEDVSAGAVTIGNRDVTRLPPAQRKIAMVFQSYALFPHLTVAQNIGFGLKIAKKSPEEIREKVAYASAALKLDQLLDRKPKALSGGQRQRVAIGRAIVRDPSAFLFDEPLSNLDAALRVEMRVELAELHRRLAATMIYVTHDQVEAMTLADMIVVLEKGEIRQVGSPMELYARPANRFVARFIGSPTMNVVPVKPHGSGVAFGDGLFAPAPQGAIAEIGVRPEHFTVGREGWPVKVVASERLGAETYLYVEGNGLGRITVRAPGDITVANGEAVSIVPDPKHIHYFDAAGQAVR